MSDVVYVPDNPLSHILNLLARDDADIRCTIATREEEAFAIAAGLYLGGTRAVVMCQSSGIGNAMNVLTSLLIPYQIPIVAIVSLRGQAGEWNAAQVPLGSGLPLILDAVKIPHLMLDRADNAEEMVTRAGALALKNQVPAMVLLHSARAES
jgi:sulfopyruvate decarboxylase alpha subunit